jgi:pyruvate dehydrogenase (quinone)
MAKNIAQLLVEVLVQAGVKRAYGVPGDSFNGITDAIRARNDSGGRSSFDRNTRRLCRQLRTGARSPGRRAVRSPPQPCSCAGHCRSIPTGEVGSRYFQETHPERLFLECSHYCKIISDPAQMPRTLRLQSRPLSGCAE